MKKIDILQQCLYYIEANLKADITLEDLAKFCGYSIDHLYKLFQEYLDISINHYINSRKLKHIAYESLHGKKINHLALEYGFESYSGFYKAFSKWYGCSPITYKNSKLALKPQVVNLYSEVKKMSQKEIKKVLANWDITINSINPYVYSGAGGIANNVWFINENRVLKKGINIEGIKTHIKVSKALKQIGFDAQTPIKTKCGKEFLIDGEFFYCLLTAVEGKYLSKEERYGNNYVNYAREYGKALAHLHTALAQLNIECKEMNLYEMIVNWAIPVVEKTAKKFNINTLPALFDDYTFNAKKLVNPLQMQIIHRDPNPSNILFVNDKVSGFVDFEISNKSIRLYDICYCATGILSETELKKEFLDKWIILFKNIVEAYNEISPLTELEKNAIPYVLYSIQLNVIAYLSKFDKYVDRQKKNIDMLLFFYNNMKSVMKTLNI